MIDQPTESPSPQPAGMPSQFSECLERYRAEIKKLRSSGMLPTPRDRVEIYVRHITPAVRLAQKDGASWHNIWLALAAADDEAECLPTVDTLRKRCAIRRRKSRIQSAELQ